MPVGGPADGELSFSLFFFSSTPLLPQIGGDGWLNPTAIFANCNLQFPISKLEKRANWRCLFLLFSSFNQVVTGGIRLAF